MTFRHFEDVEIIGKLYKVSKQPFWDLTFSFMRKVMRFFYILPTLKLKVEPEGRLQNVISLFKNRSFEQKLISINDTSLFITIPVDNGKQGKTSNVDNGSNLY